MERSGPRHIDYETCWLMLHKFRAGLDQDGRDPLAGVVEIDETPVGGADHPGEEQGRRVVVACQLDKPEMATKPVLGRIRLGVVPIANHPHLARFVLSNVVPGSHLVTDGWKG